MSNVALANGLQSPESFVDKTELAYLASRLATNQLKSPHFDHPDCDIIPIEAGPLTGTSPAVQLANHLSGACRRPWNSIELQILWHKNQVRIQARALFHKGQDDEREDPLPVNDAVARIAFSLRAYHNEGLSESGGLILRILTDDTFTVSLIKRRPEATLAYQAARMASRDVTHRAPVAAP
jgi:hypothetical protein